MRGIEFGCKINRASTIILDNGWSYFRTFYSTFLTWWSSTSHFVPIDWTSFHSYTRNEPQTWSHSRASASHRWFLVVCNIFIYVWGPVEANNNGQRYLFHQLCVSHLQILGMHTQNEERMRRRENMWICAICTHCEQVALEYIHT